MKVLVTGAAGFIGAALTIRLLKVGYEVVGVDNINNYYDPQLKRARLARFIDNPGFINVHADISDRLSVAEVFKKHRPQRAINLAAQAGVRHSIKDPHSYINSNIVGFANILEGCRNYGVDHLVYASSSSVYGANTRIPYSASDAVDHPLSLYAASKKANELMAHSYSALYQLPTTGLRFFTVYGPWCRPDMALLSFAHAIMEERPIHVFNHGRHLRDFTYIDDVVESMIRLIDRIPRVADGGAGENVDPSSSRNGPFRIYNIGSSRPLELLKYIELLEACLGREARKDMLPLQPGDVVETFADVEPLLLDTGYRPQTDIKDGVRHFVEWFLDYYKHDRNVH